MLLAMRNETRPTAIAIAAPASARVVLHRSGGQAPQHMLAVALLRIAFGVIWAVDAWLKWQPAFRANFSQIVSGGAKGQPGFLNWWFGFWQSIVGGGAPVLSLLTAATETYLALALIAGFARKFTYSVGVAYGLFVWSVAEGFGGPYLPGTTTDVGAAIIYSLVFWALLLVDAGRVSVDRLIASRLPAWRRISG